jgi:hypothetical protein
LTILYKDFFEGSGKDSPDNRVKRMLNLQKIYDLPILNEINTLRNSYEHKESQLQPETKKAALEIIRNLSGLPNLADRHEIQPDQYMLMTKRLLTRVIKELLDPLLDSFRDIPEENKA